MNDPVRKQRPERGKNRERERQEAAAAGAGAAGYLCGAAEVIVVDLFYGLEVDHTLQLGLVFVCGRKADAFVQRICFSAAVP